MLKNMAYECIENTGISGLVSTKPIFIVIIFGFVHIIGWPIQYSWSTSLLTSNLKLWTMKCLSYKIFLPRGLVSVTPSIFLFSACEAPKGWMPPSGGHLSWGVCSGYVTHFALGGLETTPSALYFWNLCNSPLSATCAVGHVFQNKKESYLWMY